jgi:hypothetical protein
MTVPPRLAPLLAQFDFARDRLMTRLEGMSDAEYFWEPVPGCWSVRPREHVRTPRSFGGGDWALEFDGAPADPPPFTTIAWRICHLSSGIALRADYTTGSKALTWDDYRMPSTADSAITALGDATDTWLAILIESSDADIDQVGRSSFPWGLDPDLPFLDICWWVNQELLHHGAEIALLRDLYTQRAQLGSR